MSDERKLHHPKSMECSFCDNPAQHAHSLARGFQPVCSASCGDALHELLIGAPPPSPGEKRKSSSSSSRNRERDRAPPPSVTPTEALKAVDDQAGQLQRDLAQLYEQLQQDPSSEKALQHLYDANRKLELVRGDIVFGRVRRYLQQASDDLNKLRAIIAVDIGKNAVTADLVTARYAQLRQIARVVTDRTVLSSQFVMIPQYIQINSSEFDNTDVALLAAQPEQVAFNSYTAELIVSSETNSDKHRLQMYQMRETNKMVITQRPKAPTAISGLRQILLDVPTERLYAARFTGVASPWEIDVYNARTLELVQKKIKLPGSGRGRLMRDENGHVLVYWQEAWYLIDAINGRTVLYAQLHQALRDSSNDLTVEPLAIAVGGQLQAIATRAPGDEFTVVHVHMALDRRFESTPPAPSPLTPSAKLQIDGTALGALVLQQGPQAERSLVLQSLDRDRRPVVSLYKLENLTAQPLQIAFSEQNRAYQPLCFDYHADGITASVVTRETQQRTIRIGRMLV